MKILKVHGAVFISEITNEEFQQLEKIEKGTFNKNENILPRPVICDGNRKLIKDYTLEDFSKSLQKETFGLVDQLDMAIQSRNIEVLGGVPEKIADIITVCISYLNAIGYNEEERSEIFCRINERNEKWGYFEK